MGRVAVVVSQCPDLGPACAGALAERGDVVALVGPGQPPGDVRHHSVPTGHSPLAAQLDALLDAAIAEVGDPDVLVTVPAPGAPQALLRSAPAVFTGQLEDGLTVPFLAARRLAPAMVAQRSGRIVFVSAIVALVGAGWESAHGAAMAGVLGLARSLARELAGANVTVNVVAAGAVETDHLAEVRDSGPRGAAMVESTVARTPLRRLGRPEEVAFAVDYLASPDASYLTGVVLPVDGGLGMGFS